MMSSTLVSKASAVLDVCAEEIGRPGAISGRMR
jgi:hypothetical protein